MRHYKYVPVDSFYGEVKTIINDYTEDITEKMSEAVIETANYGKEELKVAGDFENRTGRYRKNWKVQIEFKRLWTKATVYNGKYYPLTHLLESGHAKFLWGKDTGERVKAFPHIAAINEEVQKMIEEKAKELIEKTA